MEYTWHIEEVGSQESNPRSSNRIQTRAQGMLSKRSFLIRMYANLNSGLNGKQ